MTDFQHPGIYVQELPTTRSISSAATSNTVFVGAAETGPFNTPTLVTSWNQYVATFGGLAWGAQMPFAVYAFFVQGGSICYVVRAGAEPGPTQAPAQLNAGSLQISAAGPGVWGDSLAVTIGNYPPSQGDGAAPVFAVNVFYRMPEPGAVLTVADQLFGAYTQSNNLTTQVFGGHTFVLLESLAGFTAADLQPSASGSSNIAFKINQRSLFIRVTATAATRPANLATPAALTGGAGDPVVGKPYLPTALDALAVVNDASLLCVPDTIWIADPGMQRTAVQEVLTWCEARPHLDLFYIADTPFGLSVPDAAAFKTGAAGPTVPVGAALTSSYGALYYPWINFLNPLSDTNVPMAPSGAMAGNYAATDTAVGPWQAPAGLTYGALNIATGVTQVLADADQGVLNPDGVNAIRTFVNYGVCAYGARTLSAQPELTYIPVRRLLTMIEVSLYDGLQWVVFEPNGPQLWATVTQDVTAYLTSLWRAGALFGSTAAQAFQVQCDAGNNPPEVQAQGQLYVDIMIAPTHPAEFVVLRIQQATLGSS